MVARDVASRHYLIREISLYVYYSRFDGEKRMIDCDEPSEAAPAFQIDLFAY